MLASLLALSLFAPPNIEAGAANSPAGAAAAPEAQTQPEAHTQPGPQSSPEPTTAPLPDLAPDEAEPELAPEPAASPQPDPHIDPLPDPHIAPRPNVEPPAPALPPQPALPPPRLRRCLAGVTPCYRTTSARLLLASTGLALTGVSLAAIFIGSDRQRQGDPLPALAGVGVIAMGAASIGGLAALVRLDGPALDDRITPATLAIGLGLGGSDITDESLPYTMSGRIAPTLEFPRDLGRIRVLANFGGSLGASLERDPRPQLANADGSFPPALGRSGWRFEGGIDLAFRLPYPLNGSDAARPARLGRFELRYKPLFFYARDQLRHAGAFVGDEPNPDIAPTISERVALTPLNLGLRWNLSPRERFTFYVGPRWDIDAYGGAGALARGTPDPAPIYAEAWFDIDLRIHELRAGRRANVVGQYTVGYVHSRFDAPGMNLGAVIGFLGHVSTQFSIRVRPRGSIVAYQFELGARVGAGVHPFLRAGIVLPTFGARP